MDVVQKIASTRSLLPEVFICDNPHGICSIVLIYIKGDICFCKRLQKKSVFFGNTVSGIIYLHVDIKNKILELHRGISFTRRGSLLYTLEAGSAAEVQNRLLRLALVSRRSSEGNTTHTA